MKNIKNELISYLSYLIKQLHTHSITHCFVVCNSLFECDICFLQLSFRNIYTIKRDYIKLFKNMCKLLLVDISSIKP